MDIAVKKLDLVQRLLLIWVSERELRSGYRLLILFWLIAR